MSGYIMELISVRKIHMGIVRHFEPCPGLSSVPLFQEDLVLLAPKNDPLPSELSDKRWHSFLLNQTFYLYNAKFSSRKIIDISLHNLLGALPRCINEVNNTNSLLNLVSGASAILYCRHLTSATHLI
jgi:DNA-binding transcriptional LysR family regulator